MGSSSPKFTLSPATPSDIPGCVDIWFSAFQAPVMSEAYPDTPNVRKYLTDLWTKDIEIEERKTWIVVMKEEGSGKVCCFSRWMEEKECEDGYNISLWHARWGALPHESLPSEMSFTTLSTKFWGPMSRQHGRVMSGRPHIFLEILATLPDYQGKGLGKQLLKWGTDRADRGGMECYLDASEKGKGLYERHGDFEVRIEAKDAEARSFPMVRVSKGQVGE
ncbi:acyl-CoA N-acyltransferase [Tricladium varicosporioides]|nr:acyl-CoA N-acyltransferase [Hymenoscyphus varicosporioides]